MRRCPSCPRSRPSAAGSRRSSRARRSRAPRSSTPGSRGPSTPGLVADALVGRADRGRRAARQVPPLAAGERQDARRAPPDDRVAAACPGRRASRRRAPARDARARHGRRGRLPRRPPLRHLGAPRRRAPAGRTSRRGSAPSRSRPRSRRAARRILEGRRAPIKAVLLDQRRIAGVGNIYADEALWRARIHPRRPAGELGEDEIARLHRAVRAVLRRGDRAPGLDAPRLRDAGRRTAAGCSTSSTSTGGSGSRATAAAGRSSGSSSPAAARGSARAARRCDVGGGRSRARVARRGVAPLAVWSDRRDSSARSACPIACGCRALGYEPWGGGPASPEPWRTCRDDRRAECRDERATKARPDSERQTAVRCRARRSHLHSTHGRADDHRGGRAPLVRVRRGRPRAPRLHGSRAAASAPSRRASGGRRAGSAAGSSRSRTSSSRSTAVAASSGRSRVRRSSARTTRSAPTRTGCRSGSSGSRRCSASTPRRSGTTARSSR